MVPADPTGLPACQPSRSTESTAAGSLPALPYIRQTLGLLLPTQHHIALLVSSAALHWPVCMGGVCHCVIARLQAGVRSARLPQSFRGGVFVVWCTHRVPRKCRVSPTLSLPQLTSGAPDAPPNCCWKWNECDEILETGEQVLVSHLLGKLEKIVEGASLLLVEHPPVWP